MACLLTPWFGAADPSAATALALQTDVAIPDAWVRGLPRAGMALVVTRARGGSGGGGGRRQKFRVLLFQPTLPRYGHAEEPAGEPRERQEVWIEGLFAAVDAVFGARGAVVEGYVGGYTLRQWSNSPRQNGPEPEPEQEPLPDSVELACQFVREVVEAPSRVPEGAELVYRGFAVAEYWDDEANEE